MMARVARRADHAASSVPLHAFLFAAYPVLFLYSNNLTDVTAGDVAGPLLVVLSGTCLAFGVLSLLWRDTRRAAIVVSAVVVPLLLFGRLLRLANPVVGGNRTLLLLLCLVGVAIAIAVAVRARERLGSITLGLNTVALVLVAFTIVPIAPSLASSGRDDSVAAPDVSTGSADATDRDIWYLVFDRYGSARSLAIEYGIGENDLLPWLTEQGFEVVDDAHANYVRTNLSLAATLNMTYLDEVAARMGPESSVYQPINRSIRSSQVAEVLKGRGYEYVHIGSWFEPTRSALLADRNLDPETVVSFATTVYDESALPFLTRKLGLRASKTFFRKHEHSALFQFDRLSELVDDPGPKFVFAHVLLPHPPYVFLADGRFAPREATFESQLRYTNMRIRELLEPLLALPEDERPIIVLQADEGPYPARYVRQKDAFDWPTATSDELEMKFGILNAMYLPGPEGEAPLAGTLSSVNTFRTIFRRYLGADLPDLPDRSYVSSKARPYDLLDITDRLPSPDPGSGPSSGSLGAPEVEERP